MASAVERLQLQDQRPRQQRRDDGEGRVLGGGRDEQHHAVLDGGSSASCWVLENRCTSSMNSTVCSPCAARAAGDVDDRAHLLDPGRQRRQRLEPPARGLGDQRRERRLAGAGRAVQDDRRRARALDQAAQRRTRRSRWSWPTTSSRPGRTHPHRQRRRRADGSDPRVSARGSPGTSNRPSDTLQLTTRLTTAGCVTKSMNSSTRPMSAGSRSFQSRTLPRMRRHAFGDVGLLRRAASPGPADAVLPVHARAAPPAMPRRRAGRA